MKRILILGSSGAGKSTFAKRLQEKLNLPLINLDKHYWKPNWERTDDVSWEKTVRELVKGEKWIMDGNYRSTLFLRLPAADTIILLDPPRLICLFRIIKRRLLKNRQDKLSSCKEIISLNLLRWVLWKYPHKARPDVLSRLNKLESQKRILILKSKKEVEKFLKI